MFQSAHDKKTSEQSEHPKISHYILYNVNIFLVHKKCSYPNPQSMLLFDIKKVEQNQMTQCYFRCQ